MPYITCPELSSISAVKHAFFTRQIPESTHVYIIKENFSTVSEDVILRNRASAMACIGEPESSLSILHQIHSANVVTLTEPVPATQVIQADAQVTHIPGITLGILTADCAPVLCVDPKNHVIGAIHAGWKGARQGIIGNTVEAMCRLGASVQDMVMTIGPCIQPFSYEVGPEFRENFLEETAENARFFANSPEHTGHYMFNLPAYVLHQARAAGIARCSSLEKDTFSNEEFFFSYRRCTKRGEKYKANILSVISLVE